jgi:Uma2 family endonuclease
MAVCIAWDSAMSAPRLLSPNLIYPDSDGQPMSDNTLQFRWIVTVQGNLDDKFRDMQDVFVAGDHLIYPVEGKPKIRQAPDVYVAFGRPKGDRGSYKVFAEEGIFPQVVFEVWSPNNTAEGMAEKRDFYETYGAEEYYHLYPEFPAHVEIWRREGDHLVRESNVESWISPRLGIRFELRLGELTVFNRDGSRFLTFLELAARSTEAQERAVVATRRAETAEQRAEAEKQRAEAEKQRAERLAQRIRELGGDPEAY